MGTAHHQRRHKRTQARHGYPHRASADLWRRHTVRGATHVHRADTGTHTGPRPTCGDGTPSEAPHTYTGQTRVPTPGLGRPVGTAHHQRRHKRTQARHGYPHRASADLWGRHPVRGATHVHRADTGTHTGPRPTCGDGTPSEVPHMYTGQTRVPTPGLGRPVGTAPRQRRHTRTQGQTRVPTPGLGRPVGTVHLQRGDRTKSQMIFSQKTKSQKRKVKCKKSKRIKVNWQEVKTDKSQNDKKSKAKSQNNKKSTRRKVKNAKGQK